MIPPFFQSPETRYFFIWIAEEMERSKGENLSYILATIILQSVFVLSFSDQSHHAGAKIKHYFSRNTGFTLFTFEHGLDILCFKGATKFLNLRRRINDRKD